MATAELPFGTTAAAPSPRPQLTPLQKQAILSATGELICATITARKPLFPDPSLAGAAETPLSGAFVSLKRGKHLRACCGGLQGISVTLGKAVYDAALRSALEDMRFPPLSPTELAHLNMEIWLLFNPQTLRVRGEARVQAIIVGGKHGLVIERGESRGLLLPGVAVEHDWDAETFLEHACLKAGLHASLWKDDDTRVSTFEGDFIPGRVSVAADGTDAHRPAPPCSREELAIYRDYCLSNIRALLLGATPVYYLNASDGTVSGIALTIQRLGAAQPITVSQFSLRPGVPLQATLFNLAQGAAQALAQQRFSATELPGLAAGLTVFFDPALHGTVAHPALEGLEARHRALMVLERSKAGIVFDPALGAEELLAEGVKQAHVTTSATASLFSLEALTSESRVLISTAPGGERGPTVRLPGVAGKFYPADAAELASMVDEMLGRKVKTKSYPGALVPHAGLRFSGSVAAAVLKRLSLPDRVIIIGPKHTPYGADWAVAPHETWELPGFRIASDPLLAQRLADSIPGLTLDALAHQHEHAIEVELPFIARRAAEAKVVGIAIGPGDYESCMQFSAGLVKVMQECATPPLLIVSSDMNHFATDEENRRLDELALDALETLDPKALYDVVTENHISMCGVLPAVIVLETLRRLGKVKKAERVAYATSADVTQDTSRVVGYAGVLFA